MLTNLREITSASKFNCTFLGQSENTHTEICPATEEKKSTATELYFFTVIGKDDNTRSSIRRYIQNGDVAEVSTLNILSASEFRNFYVKIHSGMDFTIPSDYNFVVDAAVSQMTNRVKFLLENVLQK